ncbi:uncharacterized protein LOC131166718 [Malania oleifera]|uniref:uncharacterized protein LOC131166718 n=1 Tax=Malania oleifera TaxID=397392 RepID=UPI0025AE6F1C|nr:uncharacterized protein LOC131166718 [Malania oleifera]
MDWRVRRVIARGDYVPMKSIENKIVPKTEDDLSEDDMKLLQVNASAMNVIYCALDANKFNRIMACKNAKGIWDKLEITYEGTTDFKDSHIDMLTSQYEAFKMTPNESIQSMYTQFTHITNSLNAFVKTYPTYEMIRKVLRGLPPIWELKATTIAEGRNLKEMTLDELIGSLITYEMMIKKRINE